METTETPVADDKFSISSTFDEAAPAAEVVDPARGEAVAPEDIPPQAATPVADEKKPDRRTRDGKKQSIQAEIDELAARKGETEREYQATQAKLADARAELEKIAARTSTPAVERPKNGEAAREDDPEPQFDQFITEPDAATAYYRALAKWEGRQETRRTLAQEFKQREQRQAVELLETETKQKQATVKSKLDEAAKSDSTVWEKVWPVIQLMQPMAQTLAAGLPVTGATAIADCILDSDYPDRLLFHFADHRDDFQRISTLPVHLAHREMGKLEATVAAAVSGPASRPILASAAPPPTKPLGGAPRVSVTDTSERDFNDSSTIAVDEYLRRSLRK